MPDVMQINAARQRIEFIKHAVITNSQLKLGATLQPPVRERC